MTAPTYVTQNTFVEATSGNLTPAWHASPVANDVAICIFIASNAVAATFPAGWTKVGEVTGSSFYACWAWSRLTGSETSTFTITHSGSTMKAAIYGVWRGCIATGNPYEGASTNTGTGDTVTGVAVTTTDVDRLELFLSGYDNDIAGAQPSGYTNRIDQLATASTDGHMQMAELVRASAGAGSAPTSLHTAGASEWVGFGFALVPAVAASGQAPRSSTFFRMMQAGGGL